MAIEIILTGNEPISEKTGGINGWYASGCLLSHGLEVTEIRTVGNDYDTLSSVLRSGVKKSNLIIVIGGLGPTEDDLTTEIASKALDIPLYFDQTVLDRMKSNMKKSGIRWSSSLKKMAWLPKGARMLDPQATICGFSLSKGSSLIYFLPEASDQMRELLNRAVIPDILRMYRPETIPRHRILKAYGLTEFHIADAFNDLSDQLKRVTFGFYPSFPENHITIMLKSDNDRSAKGELSMAEKKIRNLLDPYIFGSDDQTMESVVGELLKNQNITISVAESCTGGLIGHRLTSISGSSVYFDRGVIVYSNRSKVEVLGVSQNTIDLYGAVSDQTVREMAAGVKKHAKTSIGLAVTGIAGPLGGTADKPVGTVFVGLSVGGKIFSGRYRFPGDREKVKLAASEMALDWVRRYINGYPFLPGI
ncbi:MAG TPA: CinA family nicotinamide mononucleotide deamidase-related protein [Desulfatiglandales bacterium]|nr:CinA family nicotinamide mononucleotide deamidase-related protein [Desulfatiglandales bacterium]